MRLTGQELLAQLQNMTSEQLSHPVKIEGCDCNGDAESVTFETIPELFTNAPRSYVYIHRTPE